MALHACDMVHGMHSVMPALGVVMQACLKAKQDPKSLSCICLLHVLRQAAIRSGMYEGRRAHTFKGESRAEHVLPAKPVLSVSECANLSPQKNETRWWALYKLRQ